MLELAEPGHELIAFVLGPLELGRDPAIGGDAPPCTGRVVPARPGGGLLLGVLGPSLGVRGPPCGILGSSLDLPSELFGIRGSAFRLRDELRRLGGPPLDVGDPLLG